MRVELSTTRCATRRDLEFYRSVNDLDFLLPIHPSFTVEASFWNFAMNSGQRVKQRFFAQEVWLPCGTLT